MARRAVKIFLGHDYTLLGQCRAMFSLCIFVSGENVNLVPALLAAGGHPTTPRSSPSTDAGRFRLRRSTTERCGSEFLSDLAGFVTSVARRRSPHIRRMRLLFFLYRGQEQNRITDSGFLAVM
jgi:hypothetical protein